MFYDIDILRRRGGKFGVVWLMAHHKLKIGFTSNKDLRLALTVDISKTCQDIEKYVKVQYPAPNSGMKSTPRFSLYLSTMLTHGTIMLHYLQVKHFLGGIESVFAGKEAERKMQQQLKSLNIETSCGNDAELVDDQPELLSNDYGDLRAIEDDGDVNLEMLLRKHNVTNITSITLPEETPRWHTDCFGFSQSFEDDSDTIPRPYDPEAPILLQEDEPPLFPFDFALLEPNTEEEIQQCIPRKRRRESSGSSVCTPAKIPADGDDQSTAQWDGSAAVSPPTTNNDDESFGSPTQPLEQPQVILPEIRELRNRGEMPLTVVERQVQARRRRRRVQVQPYRRDRRRHLIVDEIMSIPNDQFMAQKESHEDTLLFSTAVQARIRICKDHYCEFTFDKFKSQSMKDIFSRRIRNRTNREAFEENPPSPILNQVDQMDIDDHFMEPLEPPSGSPQPIFLELENIQQIDEVRGNMTVTSIDPSINISGLGASRIDDSVSSRPGPIGTPHKRPVELDVLSEESREWSLRRKTLGKPSDVTGAETLVELPEQLPSVLDEPCVDGQVLEKIIHLQEQLNVERITFKMLAPHPLTSRFQAARTFENLLKSKKNGEIDLHQDEPYCDIFIRVL